MTVKTAKQLEEDRTAQLSEQERQAAEQMAAQARGAEEDTSIVEDSTQDEELGIWDELSRDEDEPLTDTSEEEPDASSEETATSEEGEEVDSTSEEEGKETETDEQVTETSEELETGKKEGEEETEVEIPETPQETPEETRSPEQVREELQKAREQARTNLTEQFKLTEEQEELLRDSPNEVLPQLAADMYLNIFDDVVKVVEAQVPLMMQRHMQMEQQKKANEQRFFRAWPQLAKPEYMQTINRIADNYRNMHPNADPEEAVKEIGAQAWIALRLPLDELARHAEGSPQEQEVVDKVTSINSGRKPSGPGKAADANLNRNPKPLNEFEAMSEEFLMEDE